MSSIGVTIVFVDQTRTSLEHLYKLERDRVGEITETWENPGTKWKQKFFLTTEKCRILQTTFWYNTNDIYIYLFICLFVTYEYVLV